MIVLKQDGLEELKQYDYEGSLYISEYVSTIKTKIQDYMDCTFWGEDEKVKQLFSSLPVGTKGIKHKIMLLKIFSIQAKELEIQHIIVDTTLSKSDNWIYEKCGVWIMTANYFFTMLYAALKENELPVDKLEEWSKEQGFQFDIMED